MLLTHTPEEYWSDHMQTPGWQPTSCVAWCLIWLFASFKKYDQTRHRMSLLRPDVIKQHKTKLGWVPGRVVNKQGVTILRQFRWLLFPIKKKQIWENTTLRLALCNSMQKWIYRRNCTLTVRQIAHHHYPTAHPVCEGSNLRSVCSFGQ